MFRISSSFVGLLGLSLHDKWKEDPTQVQVDKKYSDLRNIAVQSGFRIRDSSANSNKSGVMNGECAYLVWSALVTVLQVLWRQTGNLQRTRTGEGEEQALYSTGCIHFTLEQAMKAERE